MESDNATNLDRESGVRGMKETRRRPLTFALAIFTRKANWI